jgi:hypothetical protein
MMEKDMGAISGSREPDQTSGSGPTGFDPARDKTQLLIADADRPRAYLELDDETLGKFARSFLIQCEQAFERYAGNKKMPLSLVTSMHGSIALYRLCAESNANSAHFNHEGVEFGGKNQGDWSITVRRGPTDEYARGEPPICEGCSTEILRGQFMYVYDDCETHANCDDPWATPDDLDDCHVLLGRPLIAYAIATEAGTAETPKDGSVHEGAGRNGIAQEDAPSSDMGKGE